MRTPLVITLSTLGLLACSRQPPSDSVGTASVTSASSSAAASASAASAANEVPELLPGASPTWPPPVIAADWPVVLRVARTAGRDVLWAYGGRGAIGMAVRLRWRDATGAIVESSSMTGGSFTPTEGWWRYANAPARPTPSRASIPAAVTVEAQVSELMLANGKKWSSPAFGWRHAAPPKPSTTDGDVGFAVSAIEREYGFGDLEGRVYVELYNVGRTPRKRVDFECSVLDRDGREIASKLGGAWVPLAGDNPHPALLAGEHDQVDVQQKLTDAAARAAWAQPGLTAKCGLKHPAIR